MSDERVEDSSGAVTSLGGIRVFELGLGLRTALTGSLLAALGAEVTRVTIEPIGTRPSADPTSAAALNWFAHVGKKAITLNCASLEGRARALVLGGEFDVVLEPEDDPTLGAEIARSWPDVVLCSVTSFGRTGPLASIPGSDLTVQALSGVMETTGEADGTPTRVGVPIADHTAALFAAIAVASVLHERTETTRVRRIDVSALDALVTVLEVFLPLVYVGHAATRDGNHHPEACPWNEYQSLDGSLVICTTDNRQWESILALADHSELRDAPEFSSVAARKAHESAVDELVEGWTTRHTTTELIEMCRSHAIPAGEVPAFESVISTRTEELAERGMLTTGEFMGKMVAAPISPLPTVAPFFDATSVVTNELRYRTLSPLRGRRSTPGDERTARDEPTLQSDQDLPRRVDGPLSGVRVLELGHYTAAPFCGRILAALGAHVVKVEPIAGEGLRHWPPHVGGESHLFHLNNSEKSLVAVDMKNPEGRQLILDLGRESDVLLCNFKPGSLDRLGLSPEEFVKGNPHLVTCLVSGFGSMLGEGGEIVATDMVIQAASGLMDCTGWPGGRPLRLGFSACDTLGGVVAALACVAGLHERSSRAVCVDVSMLHASIWLTASRWASSSIGGAKVESTRFGNGDPNFLGNGVYATTDGPIAVGVETPEAWHSLTSLLGRSGEWGEAPFSIHETQAPARGAVEEAIVEFARHRGRDELVNSLCAAGVPAAPVLTFADALNHPQIVERAVLVNSQVGNDIVVVTDPAIGIARSEVGIRVAGGIGRDTESILTGVLGLDLSAVQTLRAQGVVA